MLGTEGLDITDGPVRRRIAAHTVEGDTKTEQADPGLIEQAKVGPEEASSASRHHHNGKSERRRESDKGMNYAAWLNRTENAIDALEDLRRIPED